MGLVKSVGSISRVLGVLIPPALVLTACDAILGIHELDDEVTTLADGATPDATTDGGVVEDQPDGASPTEDSGVGDDASDAADGATNDGAATVDASDDGGVTGRVFVTLGVFTGNLGGLVGADEKCNAAAIAAGISGTYVAYLSSSTSVAWERLKDRPYNLVTGARVVDSRNDLPAGLLKHAIDTAPNGSAVTGGSWSGVLSSNAPNTINCADWTNAVSPTQGLGGTVTLANTGFDSGFSFNCQVQPQHLFCFEN